MNDHPNIVYKKREKFVFFIFIFCSNSNVSQILWMYLNNFFLFENIKGKIWCVDLFCRGLEVSHSFFSNFLSQKVTKSCSEMDFVKILCPNFYKSTSEKAVKKAI